MTPPIHSTVTIWLLAKLWSHAHYYGLFPFGALEGSYTPVLWTSLHTWCPRKDVIENISHRVYYSAQSFQPLSGKCQSKDLHPYVSELLIYKYSWVFFAKWLKKRSVMCEVQSDLYRKHSLKLDC